MNNKRRAVAAQTARSLCKVLCTFIILRLTKGNWLHGVRVIIKLYFAIFAAFKEL